jgi:hypothetical protein
MHNKPANDNISVFIDESGIHKQDGHSTTALVYVKVEHVEKVNSIVLKTESELKIEPFHWNKQMWKLRKAFLERLLKEDFEVKIFIFTNPFTDQKFETALKHLLVQRYIRTIIIDGRKPRSYVLRLKKVLRESKIHVKNIRMGNDKSYPCLRLADLFAGLTRAYAEHPDGEEEKNLYKMAKNKITIQLMDGQVPGSLFL